VNDPLIWARAIHFIATTMTAGVFLFAALVAEPAFQKANSDGYVVVGVRLWLRRIAWVGLVVALISGMAWLVFTAEQMSDRPLSEVLSDGIIGTVLTRTGFGHAWLARFALAGLLAGLLWTRPSLQTGLQRIGAVLLAATFAGTLAWSGHAVGMPGIEGGIHLSADVLHLVGVAAWVGGLVPLALLLGTARSDRNEGSLQVAHIAVLRFSTLGIVSVAAILASGVVNTWYLAGTAPALFGTDYGRFLLVKVALFLLMVSVAAINRFRLTPHLAQGQPVISKRDASRQLARNSVIEAGAGGIILAIVAVLGTLPPGLHQQPIWPFSFRISGEAFREPNLYVAILFGVACIAAGIAYRRFRWRAIAVGVSIYVVLGFRLPIIEAYPTTFFGSPTGFSAQSIATGEGVFAVQCASCHGPEGRGDGPAGELLKIEPADLTDDHVYAHTDGDLFWWITHGIAPGMPGFGTILDEEARWNLINFVRSNADGTRLRLYGGGTEAAFPTPNFSADCPDGSTVSVDQLRGQIIHIAVASTHSGSWLRQVADQDAADKLRTLVIASDPEIIKSLSVCATDDLETANTFARYRDHTKPFEGTELLVDPAGNLRSIWRSDNIASGHDADALQRRVESLRIPPSVVRFAGPHVHSH
jgi:putative copper resistance protein D